MGRYVVGGVPFDGTAIEGKVGQAVGFSIVISWHQPKSDVNTVVFHAFDYGVQLFEGAAIDDFLTILALPAVANPSPDVFGDTSNQV